MNLFFEESGNFKAGVIISQQGESYQVELQSGKRSKVKSKDVLLKFSTPLPEQLLEEAKKIAGSIEVDFLWQVSGKEEFSFTELGNEYFGHKPLPVEAAGLLLSLQASPIYFYKKGKGNYKSAPELSLKAAQAGIEKKRQQLLTQADYIVQLKAGFLPDSMRPIVLQLLFRPEKNSVEHKALGIACSELKISPQHLMLKIGGISSSKQLHFSKFLLDFFPKGLDFPKFTVPVVTELPLASVQAFSIDDETTTEIDDALSVQKLADGKVKVGIHIAAPGLGIKRDDVLDKIARQRMSTVYMPGEKITMLPSSLVKSFALIEGKNCPSLSLYITLNPEDWSIVLLENKVELVPISINFRHNTLDKLVTEENLDNDSCEYPHKEDIALLWKWTKALECGRIAKRESFGLPPEQNNRADFNFHVKDDIVAISRRKRGAPLDKIVAELMIFANSYWGKLLSDHGIPGIYRAQGGSSSGSWNSKNKVRMVTHASPHYGLGVDQYAWSTSPLRRYTDLVNQWQILACIEAGVAAPLVAPFKPLNTGLLTIISDFDVIYSGYSHFQSNMERYWCLRWLDQEKVKYGIQQFEAVVIKEETLQLIDIPLVIKLPGTKQLERGSKVKLHIIRWDEINLTVEARLLDIPPRECQLENNEDILRKLDIEVIPSLKKIEGMV